MAHHGPMLGGGRRRAASNATATSRQEQSRSFRRIRDYAAAQALSRCLELDGAGVAAALPRMQERGVADWSSADASSSSYAGARSAAAGTTATREGLDRPRLRGPATVATYALSLTALAFGGGVLRLLAGLARPRSAPPLRPAGARAWPYVPAAVCGSIVWASALPPTCTRRGLAVAATGIVSVSTPCSQLACRCSESSVSPRKIWRV